MTRNHSGFDAPRRTPLIYSRVAILLSLTTCVLLDHASAQEPQNRSKLAITSLADIDDDFRYMGEYQGQVRTANGTKGSVGLQIVALGDGKFSGMHYSSGLPGTGWNQIDREKLEGQREGALITLEGATTRVEMVNNSPMIYDKGGAIIGELHKVHRQSPTLGMLAPPNAYTLFDGVHTNAFKDAEMTDDGLMKEGTELVFRFRDFTLHAEYRLPYMPYARGQGRSNSGIYLQSSYEVQILDSFGLEGIENECGALYRYKRPDQNMCLPPLQWQTYDLTFRSPRFDGCGNKNQNARITLLHNGVAVHDDFEVERKTGAGKSESDKLWPIKFQDHSNPVRFRNIWLIDLGPW